MNDRNQKQGVPPPKLDLSGFSNRTEDALDTLLNDPLPTSVPARPDIKSVVAAGDRQGFRGRIPPIADAAPTLEKPLPPTEQGRATVRRTRPRPASRKERTTLFNLRVKPETVERFRAIAAGREPTWQQAYTFERAVAALERELAEE